MRVQANGIGIHYEIAGNGPCVTFSHSLACDHSMWDAQAAALADRYTVLRYDTRGHGRSDAPPGGYRFDQLAADVVGLLDALGIAQTHFVGLSMGGMIGQYLGLLAPQRVASLTLACTTSRLPPEAGALWADRFAVIREHGMAPQVETTLARWFTAPFRAARPDVMARIGQLIRDTPPDGYIGCGMAIAGLDVSTRLAQVACPTLVIAGAEDPGTPPAMVQEIAALIPGARLAIIPDAAHLANVEQAETFNRLLLEFLAIA